ncbi:MAG: hypothetical protein ACI9O0_000694 [Paracoccaceae bacterium]|jgi:hypothetical protein
MEFQNTHSTLLNANCEPGYAVEICLFDQMDHIERSITVDLKEYILDFLEIQN